MQDGTARGRLSAYLRQNAIGCVALFFALSGGTAMALDGSNTVFSDDIVNQEVTNPDLAQAAVTSGKIAGGAIDSGKVENDTLRSVDIFDGQIRAIDVAFGTLRGDEIQDETVGGQDITDNSLSGDDVNEASLGKVPAASSADSAAIGLALEQDQIEVNTNSIVVPGGNQDDSNGNGVSRAVSAACDASISGGDVAIAGGAYWSGNANSNSNDLENRIHSAAYLDSTGDVATNGEIPRGYRVRGEVDKDGDDTLTVQVLCFPAF